MPRRQKKYHYIYKTTCNVNGKYYIGMHSTDNLDDGYMGSGKRLWYTRKKYGDENHTKEILEFCDNRKELSSREEEIVNEQLLNEELCMNLITGGKGGAGGFKNEEHKIKFRDGIKKFLKDRWENDEEYRIKITKVLNENSKRAIENGSLFGRQNFKGKKHSEDSKKLMSEKAKERTGNKNSQYGTCWINNGKEIKKINKEALDSYLKEGWKRGRKI